MRLSWEKRVGAQFIHRSVWSGAFVLFPLVFCLIGCEENSPTKPEEPTVEEQLVGLWRRSWVGSDTIYVSLTHFEEDRSFLREVHRGDEEGEVVLSLEGHYFVAGDTLYMAVETSSDPSNVGIAMKYRVIFEDKKIYLVFIGEFALYEKVESP